MASTEDLVRIVGLSDGSLVVNRLLPGRGAWLCRGSLSCLDRAGRRGGFARALRLQITPDAVARLRQSIVDGDGVLDHERPV